MDTAVKIKGNLIEHLDRQKDRLGFTRQRLTNNLLRVALNYLDKNGYEDLIELSGAKNEVVQASK